jgi:hypothetical protein
MKLIEVGVERLIDGTHGTLAEFVNDTILSPDYGTFYPFTGLDEGRTVCRTVCETRGIGSMAIETELHDFR